MNKPVASLFNNAFTAIPSWFSSFFSPTFIHTSHSSCSVCHTSLILLVILERFNLLPNFSGCNTLYRLLEASWKLTVLYCFLPTLAVFLLPFPFSISPNNFWPYGPTFCTHSKFYLLPFLYPYSLHLGLSLDPFGFDWVYLAPGILHCCFQPSVRGHLEASQNTLDYSREGVLS